MADDPDPPRKSYQLKPRAFEVVNHHPPAVPANSGNPPGPDPGPAESDPGRIDLHAIIREANRPGPALIRGGAPPVGQPNEVHQMLRENLARADAAGLNEVAPVRKFHRRKRDYIVLMIGGNGFIAIIYAIELLIGFQVQCLAARMPFELWNLVRYAFTTPSTYALPVMGMAFFSAAVAWLMFGVMDDY